jgi:bleomycin hydrolase
VLFLLRQLPAFSADLNMGGQPSKVSQSQLADEKLIIERLRALQTKESSSADSEYVCIGNEKQRQYASSSAGLSISAIKHWEHELLQDPKNRYARSPLLACPKLSISMLTHG